MSEWCWSNDCGTAVLHGSSNYLAHAVHADGCVALPQPRGVRLLARHAVTAAELDLEADVTVVAVAWSPAARDLLAVALAHELSVQLWRLDWRASEAAAGGSAEQDEEPLAGCRLGALALENKS